jgi:hypothetical protein
MSEIPEFYQYRKKEGEKSQLHPFSYRSEDGTFIIAETEIPVAHFDPYSFNPHLLDIDSEGLEIDEIANYPVMIPNYGNLIAGPKLHKWADTKPSELFDAYKVMHEAFTSFIDNASDISGERSRSHMGFCSGLSEYGGVHLQVWGNCACMGSTPHGLYVRDKSEHGFAEYDLHNADVQAQRTSLYAGLGHLARRAAEDGGTLF